MVDEKKIKEAFFKIKQEIESLKEQIDTLTKLIKQTNQQTNTQFFNFQQEIPTSFYNFPTQNQQDLNKDYEKNLYFNQKIQSSTGNKGVPTNKQTNQQTNQQTDLNELVTNIDNLKRDLKDKFENLTDKEFLVFSAIYQETKTTYPQLSSKLGLTETTIRDYVRKLIIKQLPIQKIKTKNNKIILKIPDELKKISTLESIIRLRYNGQTTL